MNEQETEPGAYMLDAERGISVSMTFLAGKRRPVLKQGPLRMILTPEIIHDLNVWSAQQQASFYLPAEHSEDEQKGK